MGHGNGLPEELIADYEKNEELLKKVHHVLLEVSEFIKTADYSFLIKNLLDLHFCKNVFEVGNGNIVFPT